MNCQPSCMVQHIQPASCQAPQTCSRPIGGGICQRRPCNQHCLGPSATLGPLGWRLVVCLLGVDGIKRNRLAQGPLPVDSRGLQAPLGLGASMWHGVQRSPSQSSTSWWPQWICTVPQMFSQTCSCAAASSQACSSWRPEGGNKRHFCHKPASYSKVGAGMVEARCCPKDNMWDLSIVIITSPGGGGPSQGNPCGSRSHRTRGSPWGRTYF